MNDYPAAHSMDTTWFAIDRDGHVAAFDSGEAGCVPTDAYLGEDYGPLEDALRALPEAHVVHDLAGRRAAASSEHASPGLQASGMELLVFVRDLAAARATLGTTVVSEVAASEGAALVVRADPAVLATLHAEGACVGCFSWWEDEERDLAAFGAYRYVHASDNVIAGPYAREAAPATPLVMSEIPPDIVEKAARFDGRFADTPALQPAELWPCEAWGASWLASDGKTVRPFPGREADFAKEAADLREAEPGWLIVGEPLPPPQTPARATVAQRRRPWWKFW